MEPRKSRSDTATWSQAFANLVAVLVSSESTIRRQCPVAGGHLDLQESEGLKWLHMTNSQGVTIGEGATGTFSPDPTLTNKLQTT